MSKDKIILHKLKDEGRCTVQYLAEYIHEPTMYIYNRLARLERNGKIQRDGDIVRLAGDTHV